MIENQICKQQECTGCGVCMQSCPVNAIEMRSNEEGFLYPYIDEHKCINCGLCHKRCPNNQELSKNEASFYMAWHRDDDVLENSSSGGVFTAIANLVLDKGGVVFGAVLDQKSRQVFHTYTQTKDGIIPMRLSKYYQSDVRDSFKEVKKFLDDGRFVLFTGTGCQVAGLYSYLGNHDFKNLLTMDVLCHGVTSQKVVEKYISSQEKKYKKKITEFRFRNKSNEWKNGGVLGCK